MAGKPVEEDGKVIALSGPTAPSASSRRAARTVGAQSSIFTNLCRAAANLASQAIGEELGLGFLGSACGRTSPAPTCRPCPRPLFHHARLYAEGWHPRPRHELRTCTIQPISHYGSEATWSGNLGPHSRFSRSPPPCSPIHPSPKVAQRLPFLRSHIWSDTDATDRHAALRFRPGLRL